MPGSDTRLNQPPASARPGRARLATALARLAYVTFAAFLILLLGANGQAASGGPLAWWPVWQLPASGGEWAAVGVVGLLPPLSAAAWLAARALAGRLRALAWRPNRVTWPLLALAALAVLSLARQCAGGCPLGTTLRLGLVLAHLTWVTLYVVNERPPLLPIVALVVLAQSVVALGQFFAQHDLGLRLLGELPLNPAVSGVIVAMRGDQRWLRAYGLTVHPNVLASTLAALLLMLPVLERPTSAARRALLAVVFAVGFAALLATLARWALFCFGLGLAINGLGQLRTRREPGATPIGNLGRGTWLALLLIGGLFLAVYGDVVLGRAVALESPVESRSLWERDRDARIALRLVGENPLLGVGLDQYLPAARRYDAWAEIVHNVPLWLAAELGLGAALAWLWLLLAPAARRGALGAFAPYTALWLGYWLMGLLQTAPHPLNDLRSALLTGLVAALLTLPPGYFSSARKDLAQATTAANLPDTSGSCTIAGWVS